MDGDTSSGLPPSIRGVVLFGVALVVAILVGSCFAYFGWKALDGDLALTFPVMAAGTLVLTGGMAWTSVEMMRQLWEPSIPRARDGVLEVRIPRRLRRSLRLCGFGGVIFAAGGVMGIWLILTDEPVTWFRASAVVFLVLMLLFLVGWFASALLSHRMLFVADGWGLRFDSPILIASVHLPWTDVARLSRRGGPMFGPRLVATTEAGRIHVIPIAAASLPMSREAHEELFSEIESLRPAPEPERSSSQTRPETPPRTVDTGSDPPSDAP